MRPARAAGWERDLHAWSVGDALPFCACHWWADLAVRAVRLMSPVIDLYLPARPGRTCWFPAGALAVVRIVLCWRLVSFRRCGDPAIAWRDAGLPVALLWTCRYTCGLRSACISWREFGCGALRRAQAAPVPLAYVASLRARPKARQSAPAPMTPLVEIAGAATPEPPFGAGSLSCSHVPAACRVPVSSSAGRRLPLREMAGPVALYCGHHQRQPSICAWALPMRKSVRPDCPCTLLPDGVTGSVMSGSGRSVGFGRPAPGVIPAGCSAGPGATDDHLLPDPADRQQPSRPVLRLQCTESHRQPFAIPGGNWTSPVLLSE